MRGRLTRRTLFAQYRPAEKLLNQLGSGVNVELALQALLTAFQVNRVQSVSKPGLLTLTIKDKSALYVPTCRSSRMAGCSSPPTRATSSATKFSCCST